MLARQESMVYVSVNEMRRVFAGAFDRGALDGSIPDGTRRGGSRDRAAGKEESMGMKQYFEGLGCLLKCDNGVSIDFMETSQHGRLLDSVRGKRVYIPDLKRVFQGWPGIDVPKANANLGALELAVNERLRSVYLDERKQRKLKAADFALFSALWWPSAPFEELCTLAFFIIWLFTWDDEVDESTGSFTDGLEAAQGFREHTVRYIAEFLGVTDQYTLDQPSNEIIGNQRERFFRAIVHFIMMTQKEQEMRLSDRIPSLAEYWSYRMGTSGVYTAMALVEYSTMSHLPRMILDAPLMQVICDETTVIIAVTNDILSLKKEIEDGSVGSIVPLTTASGKSVQESVDEAVDILEKSRHRFDKAAEDLLASSGATAVTRNSLSSFIDVCRSNCVGNLIWR
ncbi:MAG: hypothetical protein Q9227_000187 [Pyrenula ochraceoflavens]